LKFLKKKEAAMGQPLLCLGFKGIFLSLKVRDTLVNGYSPCSWFINGKDHDASLRNDKAGTHLSLLWYGITVTAG
jgi:hypothetical protein